MSNTSKEVLLNELTRKRGELAGELERLEIKRGSLIADIGAIDATIAIYDPAAVRGKITPKKLPPVHPAGRGNVSHFLLAVLREAKEPISTYDLNIKLMQHRGLNLSDGKLVKMMHTRTLSTLKNYRDRKILKSTKPTDSKFSVWEMVR